MSSDRVYLLLLSGESSDAIAFISGRYPGSKCVVLSKQDLRGAGWLGQIRAFRRIEGRALVFFLRGLSELPEPQLTVWSGLFHRCALTVVADSSGQFVEYGTWDRLRLLPKTLASAAIDFFIFALGFLLLQLFRNEVQETSEVPKEVDLDLAYLYPYPLDTALAGGSHTHVKGFLSGVAPSGVRCEVFSARSLPTQDFHLHVIPTKRRRFLFRESVMLSYNLRFALAVRKLLRGVRVGALYQRHGRFVVAGALLSGWLHVPLVLEFNGSESWIAKYWTPVRFTKWLCLCERASLSRAHLIVVVSEPLRQELLQRGVPEEKILVNPNGVDPEVFHPGCGGQGVRDRLGVTEAEIIVAFVGTFDQWHGTAVLRQAIEQCLENPKVDPMVARLRFLLVGEGPLSAEMRVALQAYAGKRVFFTGLVQHSEVPAHLDAADILVSPHVPMPDGRPFFGSPTKLFEYMAMAKGIVASDLDQLSRVLKHRHSAWLVEPGNAPELASAIILLARDPDLRKRLGENARESALAGHTWQHNANRVLTRVRSRGRAGELAHAASTGVI
jgi:glycosyltransferase involved in cell wall biosynthesis